MNKDTYLQQLVMLLSDLSPAERDEAVQYYRDYIEDAGLENEASILQELGSPEKLAYDIKQGLGISPNASNYQTNNNNTTNNQTTPPPNQAGYNYQQQNQAGYNYQQPNRFTNKLTGWQLALVIALIVIASPLWLSVLASAVSFIVAIFFGALGIFIAIAAVGIAFVICFFAILATAIANFLITPLVSVFLIGLACIFGGIGIFSLLLCGIICTRFIPWLCKGIATIWNNIFHRNDGRRMTA